MRLPSLSLRPKAPGTVGPQPSRPADLPADQPTPFNLNSLRGGSVTPASRRCHPLPGGTGILNRFPIGYALRLHLRSRLTLIRLALIRNPWVFGGGVSHPSYRYSCLQFRFQQLQRPSQTAFSATGMLPYHCHTPERMQQSTVSVVGLMPDHYRRQAARPVSYYALF